MKNTGKYLLPLVAAATMLAACSKDEPATDTDRTRQVTLQFTADDETRTTLDQNRIIWQTGDKAGVFIDSTVPTTNAEATIDLATRLFTATVNAYATSDRLYTYYPYYSGNTSTEVSLRISPEQSVTAGIFNGSYNPLAGVPQFLVHGSDAANTPLPKVLFRQLGSIVELHVYSDSYRDEQVESVRFEADTPLAGNAAYDLTQVNAQGEIPAFAPASDKAVNVTLKAPVAVGADRTAPAIYMVVAPGTYTGSFVVTTDEAVYTFPVEGMEFRRAAIKPLGLALTADKRDAGVVTDFYGWTIGKGAFEAVASGTTIQGDPALRWQYAMQNPSYAAPSNDSGYQIGTSSSPAQRFTLTTDKFAGRLGTILVTARTGQTATLAVSVNGTQVGSTEQLTASKATYTFTLPEAVATEEVTLDFKPTAKALFLYSVTFVPDGYVPLELAVPAPRVDPADPTVVEWAPVEGAAAYEYVIGTDAPERTYEQFVDVQAVKGQAAEATAYEVKVRAVGDGVEYAEFSDYSAAVAVTVPARPGDIGPAWYYLFSSATVWPLNGTATLASNDGTALAWTMAGASSSTWDKTSASWKLASNNSKSNTTLATSGYAQAIRSVSVGLKTNSKKYVDVAVRVGDTNLACEGAATVHFGSATDTKEEVLQFSSDVPLSGTVTVSLTDPTGGFGMQSLSIN